MPPPKRNESKLIGHAACLSCPSSDGMAVYDDDHAYCFVCNTYQDLTDSTRPKEFITRGTVGYKGMTTTSSEAIDKSKPAFGSAPTTLTDRRLSKATLEKYGVTLRYGDGGKVTEHFYPYFDANNNHVATKIRIVEGKQFVCSGDMRKGTLFGMHLVPSGGKYITITEGEIDAMSVSEMMGYPAVSVKSSSSAYRDVKENFDYINSFENIILCFDTDTGKPHPKTGELFYPGQEAANEVARMFKAGKVKIVNHHPFKDANDFLKNGQVEQFKKRWWDAPPFQIDGIVCSKTLWDEINRKEDYFMVSYPFDQMNEKLYGLRTSEMITFTAGTGVGKTTLLKHIAVWIKENLPPEYNVGLMMLEETLRETSLGLMSVKAGKPLHLPDYEVSDEERRKAFAEVLGDGRFFFHDHFGSTSIDNVVDKIEKLATQYDCKYIILDHISIVVSDQQQGDERRALDELATKLKTLTINKDICLMIVCHLKRIDGKPAEEGGQISLSDLRGTAAIGQLSNLVLGLERDLQGTESNKVRVRCLKDRFAGRTGIVAELEFDYPRFKYNEVLPSDESPADKFTKH